MAEFQHENTESGDLLRIFLVTYSTNVVTFRLHNQWQVHPGFSVFRHVPNCKLNKIEN